MAKFCGNCGMKLEDSAKVCGNCGTPLNGVVSKINKVKVKGTKKKHNFGKKVKAVLIFVILVVLIGVGINIALNFTGNKGLVRKIMAAYEDYDIETIVSLSSDMYYYAPTGYDGTKTEIWDEKLETYKYQYDADALEDYVKQSFKNIIGKDLDSFEATVGHSYKLSYEINEIYELSERKNEEWLEEIESNYPEFDVSVINKITVADITITVTQGSKSVNRDLKITMTKEKDTWKLLHLE